MHITLQREGNEQNRNKRTRTTTITLKWQAIYSDKFS